MNEGISRRNFIGGAALGGAALALGALAGCAPQGDKPTGSEGAWDAEVDLLVCGCGGAGMACAVEAKDNGVENVLIIEKGDQIGGTTAMSQGMIAGWDTQLQKSQGVELTYDAMYANLMNNASYHLDPALTKITVENSGKTIDWLIDRVGVKFTDQIDIYRPLQMMHNVDGGRRFRQLSACPPGPAGRGESRRARSWWRSCWTPRARRKARWSRRRERRSVSRRALS
ncbi:MAG: FAD-dependent oxidoreductase [Eggerthella lenta]